MATKSKSAQSKSNPVSNGLSGLAMFTVEAFSPIISWHPESVRRACREGRIKAVKAGRDWRIPHAEVERISREGIPAMAA